MPKRLRTILEQVSKMPRHPKDNNAWIVKSKEHMDAIKDHTEVAGLYGASTHRNGRSLVHTPQNVRIEKEKGLLKKKIPHLLG